MSISNGRLLSFASLVGMLVGVVLVALVLIPNGLDGMLRAEAAGGTDPSTNPAALFGFGLMGAVMTGWSVSIFSLASRLEALNPATLGLAVARGAISWFLLDSGVSLVTGFAWNVLPNVGFLLLLLLPALGLMRQD